MVTMIDFHTHRKTAEGVITPRSFGIHPWNADEVTTDNRDEFLDRYGEEMALAEIIGECGLDKACSSSWEQQRRLFRWQAEYAAELNKPMVIHCVRAFNEVVTLRKELLSRHKGKGFVNHQPSDAPSAQPTSLQNSTEASNPNYQRSTVNYQLSPFNYQLSTINYQLPPWVIHGYIGGLQMADQLFRDGIWVSFGAAILDPRREKVRQCLAEIKTPFFLETDDSDIGIERIYQTAANIRGCSMEELIALMCYFVNVLFR